MKQNLNNIGAKIYLEHLMDLRLYVLTVIGIKVDRMRVGCVTQIVVVARRVVMLLSGL